ARPARDLGPLLSTIAHCGIVQVVAGLIAAAVAAHGAASYSSHGIQRASAAKSPPLAAEREALAHDSLRFLAVAIRPQGACLCRREGDRAGTPADGLSQSQPGISGGEPIPEDARVSRRRFH